jgi:hypothetical protein
MEHAPMSAVRTTRDWRGLKYQVSSCSTEELFNLLTNAIMTTNQVAKFIAEVQAELIVRGEIPSDSCCVA